MLLGEKGCCQIGANRQLEVDRVVGGKENKLACCGRGLTAGLVKLKELLHNSRPAYSAADPGESMHVAANFEFTLRISF
jgi:hypothetical protein